MADRMKARWRCVHRARRLLWEPRRHDRGEHDDGSDRQRHAVLAMVGGAEHHAAGMVDPDRLAAAERLLGPGHVMAARLEIGRDALENRRLQRELAVIGEAA